MARGINTVRVATNEEVIEIPWKLSRTLRGNLVGAREHSVAREFANKGTSAQIVLDRAGKEALLGAVFQAMKEGSDEQARHLVELRNALRADLGHS